MKEFF